MQELNKRQIASLLDEMIEGQRTVLFNYGKKIVPTLTIEDLWQPNDFPELENNPLFRYEEGLLAGILAVQVALRASGTQEV